VIIDGHAHAARQYSMVESIQEMARTHGLAKIVLCTSMKNDLNLRDPPSVPFAKTPNSIFVLNRMLRFTYNYFMKDQGDGNRYVAELKSRLPGLVLQFIWVNPLDAQHMNEIENNIQTYQVRGIKLHQAWNPFSIDSKPFHDLIEVARSHKLPVFIHLYSQMEARKLLRFIGEHRDVVFIIGHLLGIDIFEGSREQLQNVYFDTSGSSRIRPADILKAVRLFGGEHVVFGSDMPFAGIGDQLAKIQALDLSDSVKERILGLNMKDVLRLAAE
jgi:predicted TIM-barrel fold metal-dependent hydrolase